METKAFFKDKLEVITEKDKAIFKPLGFWIAGTVREMEKVCQDILKGKYPKDLMFDLSKLEGFDTSGVWLIERTLSALRQRSYNAELINANEAFINLSSQLKLHKPSLQKVPQTGSFFVERIIKLGKSSEEVVKLTYELIVFLGQITLGTFGLLINPRKIRLTSIISHIENFGVNSLPIVSVIAVALGLVLAYQGEEQLRKFGAEIYTINLVSISVVREVGILITAILIAGRSGSAITAEIGIMKINQEVDALNTLGLSPMVVLILPRIIALTFVMPLLAFVSDIMGLLGGGIMVMLSLDVSPQLYIYRLGEAITVGSFWVGVLKAPFFGAIIGIVSCFEGMRVQGTAESVGICTTRSVVEGIFLVTLADAFLSVFFSKIGI
jgi:phospholipid/cholesterol/gamma-HCH transport system permease protein